MLVFLVPEASGDTLPPVAARAVKCAMEACAALSPRASSTAAASTRAPPSTHYAHSTARGAESLAGSPKHVSGIQPFSARTGYTATVGGGFTARSRGGPGQELETGRESSWAELAASASKAGGAGSMTARSQTTAWAGAEVLSEVGGRMQVCAGVATGQVFCGMVGNDLRWVVACVCVRGRGPSLTATRAGPSTR